jgi:hypothetical protein
MTWSLTGFIFEQPFFEFAKLLSELKGK